MKTKIKSKSQSRKKLQINKKQKKHQSTESLKTTPKLGSKKKTIRTSDRPLGKGTTRLSQTTDRLKVIISRQKQLLKIKNGLLKNGASKLQLSADMLRDRNEAMDFAADGIFIIDIQKPGFEIIYANQSMEKIFGFTKTIGKHIDVLCGKYADDHIAEEMKLAIGQRKPFFSEVVTLGKGGKKKWGILRLAPVKNGGGNIRHYVGTQTDVTQIRERELKIKAQREELLHVTRVGKLAEFVSSLAHEISQPLSAILSYAQAAQRMLGRREPKIHEILQYIVADDERAVAVIKRMRTLLKKSKHEMKLLDINAIIKETIAILATESLVRNCVVAVELKAKLPPVRGDRIELQQVLLNLISNSFDAMENVEDQCSILIRTMLKAGNMLQVEVKDSGCGIPKKNMAKLFSRFFTSKSDGLGMGLSISRSIIEAHGGRLEAQNNPDRGASFIFSLPIDKKDAR